MRSSTFLACATLCLTVDLAAQNWGLTATAPQQGSSSSTVALLSTQTVTLPPGPVAPGVFLSSTAVYGSGFANSSASWSPGVPSQVAPLAFTATVQGSSQHNSTSFASTTLGAVVDLTMQTPQPVGGRLLVRYLRTGGQSASIRILAGPGAPGSGVIGWAQGFWDVLDIPIPVGVVDLRLTYELVVGSSGSSGLVSASMIVQAQFFPDEPAMHWFDWTGATESLLVSHPEGSCVTLSLPTSAGQVPIAIAIGFQPVVQPLLPTVTQLVTLDAVFFVGSLTILLPDLPSGSAVYSQGLTLSTQGLLRGSNSVRAIWP